MSDRKALFAVEVDESPEPGALPLRVQFVSLTLDDVEVRLQAPSDFEALPTDEQMLLMKARNFVLNSLEGAIRQGRIPGRMPLPSRVATYWSGDTSTFRVVIED